MKAADQTVAEGMLRKLRTLGLLQQPSEASGDSAGGRFTMHPLIRELAQQMLQSDEEAYKQAAERYIKFMLVTGEQLTELEPGTKGSTLAAAAQLLEQARHYWAACGGG